MKITKEEYRYFIILENGIKLTIDFEPYYNNIKIDIFPEDMDKLIFPSVMSILKITDRQILENLLKLKYITNEEYLQLVLLLL